MVRRRQFIGIRQLTHNLIIVPVKMLGVAFLVLSSRLRQSSPMFRGNPWVDFTVWLGGRHAEAAATSPSFHR